MAWVTISLRKMTLTARISNMEYRLMTLSQDKQSQQMSAGYSKSKLNLMKNMEYQAIDQAFNNQVQGFNKNDQNYSINVQQANLWRQNERMSRESIFQAMEDSQLQENNRKEQQIDQEIEVLQTQLKAARAEEENLGKALDEDIKKSAINLM